MEPTDTNVGWSVGGGGVVVGVGGGGWGGGCGGGCVWGVGGSSVGVVWGLGRGGQRPRNLCLTELRPRIEISSESLSGPHVFSLLFPVRKYFRTYAD